MSYHPGHSTSGLRWRPEGIELRCSTCPAAARWWPLTEEFWSFRQSFRRCRACVQSDKNRRARARLRDEKVRNAGQLYQAAYRENAREALRIKSLAYYWADPEARRAAKKVHYYANRERILAERRRQYAERKQAA